LTESLRSLSERLRAKPRRLELVCSQPAQADSAIKANLGAAPFDDDEVKSIRAYYCGAIFNPSTRLSAKVVDAIEYLFDATIALGVLGLGLVITMFIRRKHGDDKWKPSTKNASLLLVLATIILLLWPPMTAASGDWIHTFDPELTLINPMSLVPLYLIMLVTLTLHYVTKTGEKLISALAAVLAAAFNAIAVFNPALVGRLFSMDDIGSFAFFTACTLIELSILAVIAYTLGGNAPDATVRS
jgi:hypothetical protein